MMKVRPLLINRKKEAMVLIERHELTLPNIVLPKGMACSDDPELVRFVVLAVPDDTPWLQFKAGDRVIVGVPSGFQRVNPMELDKTRTQFLVSSRFVLGVVESGDHIL